MTVNDKQRTRASKFLSKHLRHAPADIGLTLVAGGWVEVDTLLAACATHGLSLTRGDLDEIVRTSDKQRFAFDETGTRVRANQGHSVDVDLELVPVSPPDLLFHGTAEATLPLILESGLRKMRRHHVHLSADRETARNVGTRHGKPVVLAVAARRMAESGFEFFVSANGVWLVDRVPPEFLLAEPTT